MSDTDATLNSIFSIEVANLPPIIAAAMESTNASSELKEAILKHGKDFDWGTVFGAIVEKVHELFDMNLSEIMMTGWNKYGLLAECVDEEKCSPGESVLVALAEHSFTSKHEPSIEVLVNEKSTAKLPFTITLTLNLKGAELMVQDKKIREIRLGEVGGEGSIKCGEIDIATQEFDSRQIPGTILLDPGLEIPTIDKPRQHT
ncbi:MAG: hypothetical protein OER97_06835 [Gammaproteobacteria bacterium]|nr:hypothetical protein [Gammaproteobacteria bacterium]